MSFKNYIGRSEQPALAATVIIPCYNATFTLPDQLDALSRQTFDHPFELIIVDNASTDGLSDMALTYADRFTSLRFVEAKSYRGAGYARNEGVKAARTEKILFCDADDIVCEGWIAALVSALDQAVLVGGGRDFHKLNESFCLHEAKQSVDPVSTCDVHFTAGTRFKHVGAGNMGVSRSFFIELGGFDVNLPIHEDADLCIRAQQLGYKLELCPEALIHIRCHQNFRNIFRQAFWWGYWSVALHKKHKHTLGKQPVIRPVLGLIKFMLSIVFVRSRVMCGSWVFRFGWKIGRLYGSAIMGWFVL